VFTLFLARPRQFGGCYRKHFCSGALQLGLSVNLRVSFFFSPEEERCFGATVCRRLKLHRVSDPLQSMDHLPGVSIVKPLMGVDPFLETNLESHFTLAYPKV